MVERCNNPGTSVLVSMHHFCSKSIGHSQSHGQVLSHCCMAYVPPTWGAILEQGLVEKTAAILNKQSNLACETSTLLCT